MLVEKNTSIYIDLDAEKGDAYALLGFAKQLCSIRKIDYAEVHDKMISSNYINLVCVFESYFGDVVDLATDNPELKKALS
jgi:hypothetical protein